MGNTFISWSGDQSKHVALALHEWLPVVVGEDCVPFVSDIDIERGDQFFRTIEEQLAGARFGIVVLRPETLQKPWVMFEAGALATTVSGKVAPYCTGGLQKNGLSGPLSVFNACDANQEDTGKLVASIAKALCDDEASAENKARLVTERFPSLWPRLEKRLSQPPEAPTPSAEPGLEEMVKQILTMTRAIAREVEHMRPFDWSGLATPGVDVTPDLVEAILGRAGQVKHFEASKELRDLINEEAHQRELKLKRRRKRQKDDEDE